MSDGFFQECIEAEQDSILIAAIESGEVGIESRDCYDRTALMVALDSKKPELVSALLALVANPNSSSNDGETCLSRAIAASDTVSLRLLLDAGADIELQSSNFLTPLALSAGSGNIEIIDYLLQRGANIEAKGEMEETPLIEAAFFGQAEVVKFLLKKGADRAAKDAFGRTALEVATEQGWPNVIAVLTDPRR